MPNPDGRISTRDLCNDVVSTRTIADGAVDGNKLADGAVDSITKFASSITPVQIVSSLPGSASEGDTAYLTTDNKLYRYDGSAWIATVDTSDLSGTISETQIADDSISTPKLQANAVTAAKIAVGTITANEIASNTITAGQIASGAISTDELAANAVTAAKIAAGEITVAKLTVGGGPNLIGDPSFEADSVTAGTGTARFSSSDGRVTAWEYTNTDGATIEYGDTGALSIHTGSGVLRFSKSSPATAGTGTQVHWTGGSDSYGIRVAEGDVLRVSAWVNNYNTTTGKIYIGVHWLDESGLGITQSYVPGSGVANFNGQATNTWTQWAGAVTAPSGAVYGRMRILLANFSGTVYVDDVSFSTGADTTYISSLSADKITTGTLDASTVTVTNLNASNITTGTINGINVRTTSSGIRIQMNPTSNRLEFTNSSGTSIADIYTDGTDLYISTVDAVIFQTGDIIGFDNNVVVGSSLTLYSSGGIDAAGTVYTTQVDSSSSLYLDAGSASTLYLRHGTTSKLQISSGGVSAYIIGPNALRLLRAGATDSGGTGYRMVRVSN